MTANVIPLDIYRRVFAEEVGALANLQTLGLVKAIATVPREDFLGPGPWKIFRTDGLPGSAGSYVETPNSDPRHVLHKVLVALDATRGINNGRPSLVTSWIDALQVSAGLHIVHIGCGAGYYTAIIAAVADRIGKVTAIEADPALAERARKALVNYPAVNVQTGDGAGADFDDAKE
jgi:protein-L-isoaspartate(D-aspartate) O-methyltransferase